MPNQEYRGIPIEKKLLDGAGLSTVLGLIKTEVADDINQVYYNLSNNITGLTNTYVQKTSIIPTAGVTGTAIATIDGKTIYAPVAEEGIQVEEDPVFSASDVANLFIVYIGNCNTRTETCSFDRSYSEISAAVSNGKEIVAYLGDTHGYQLASSAYLSNNGSIEFFFDFYESNDRKEKLWKLAIINSDESTFYAEGVDDPSLTYVAKTDVVPATGITGTAIATISGKTIYAPAETDPVFSASPAAGITAQDISTWNAITTGLTNYVPKTVNSSTINSTITFEPGHFSVEHTDQDENISSIVETMDSIQLSVGLAETEKVASVQLGLKDNKTVARLWGDIVNINGSTVTITGLTTPTIPNDAANKAYVDNAIASISAPVTSVNGATGTVVLDADDISYSATQSIKDKIDDIVTTGGEPNVIETVKVNGTALTPTNKEVNVIVPIKVSDLTNDSNFISGVTVTSATTGTTIAAVDGKSITVDGKITLLSSVTSQSGGITTNGTLKSIDGLRTFEIPAYSTSITNNNQVTTKKYVDDTIASAIGGITGVEFNTSYTTYASLPATGESGVIYLIPNSGSTPNIYDEYIYASGSYEKIGTTETDLSGYVKTSDLATVATSGSYNDLANKPSIPTAASFTSTYDSRYALAGHTHDYSKVSVTQTQTSGTEIGKITVDNVTTTLYAPDQEIFWASYGNTQVSEIMNAYLNHKLCLVNYHDVDNGVNEYYYLYKMYSTWVPPVAEFLPLHTTSETTIKLLECDGEGWSTRTLSAPVRSVTATSALTTGITIGTVDINGTTTIFYAPTVDLTSYATKTYAEGLTSGLAKTTDLTSYVAKTDVTPVAGVTGTAIANIGGKTIYAPVAEGGVQTETDPVFQASVASGITATDISRWNGITTIVSNVQSDWNATTGASVILNKPTIPTAASFTSTYDSMYAAIGHTHDYSKVTVTQGVTTGVTIGTIAVDNNGTTTTTTLYAPNSKALEIIDLAGTTTTSLSYPSGESFATIKGYIDSGKVVYLRVNDYPALHHLHIFESNVIQFIETAGLDTRYITLNDDGAIDYSEQIVTVQDGKLFLDGKFVLD